MFLKKAPGTKSGATVSGTYQSQLKKVFAATKTTTHGTITRTGITCKKIPLQKFIEFGMALK